MRFFVARNATPLHVALAIIGSITINMVQLEPNIIVECCPTDFTGRKGCDFFFS